jgi:hypothetical protein
LRGARLRHLRLINAAVLDRRYKKEAEESYKEDEGGEGGEDKKLLLKALVKEQEGSSPLNINSDFKNVKPESKIKLYDVVKEIGSSFQVCVCL